MLVAGDVFHRLVQNRKLLLKELNTVVCNLLGHFDIEELIAESFVVRELHPKFIAEFLPHLLGNQ